MSASIYFKPVNVRKHSLPGQSAVVAALCRAGFPLPFMFNENSKPILVGMAAAWDHLKSDNPYQAILDAIEKYGSIEVWVEY